MKPQDQVARFSGMRRWWIGIVVIMTACGAVQTQPSSARSAVPTPSATAMASAQSSASSSPSTPSSPTPSPSPQAAASKTLLFAALEAKGNVPPNQWNTLAIAGLDGYARAKATFTPLPSPYVGCAGPVLPASAQVADGKVFFADGTGAVRSLGPAGQLASVTSFPLTSSQQTFSFAVSPDGTHLLATILTWPPKPAVANACNGGPMFAPGDFIYDIYSAQAGGPSRLLSHQTFPQGGTQTTPSVMELQGWDQVGPFGVYPAGLATQGGGPVHYPGFAVGVDSSTGKVLKQISDPQSCFVWDIQSTGDFVCSGEGGSGGVSVRRPDGSEIWHFTASPNTGYEYEFLSPDELHVVALGAGTEVLGRDGTDVKLPDSFYYADWLDNATVIGGGYTTNFGYISLNAPGTVVDIGFKAMFLGTVQL